MIDKEIKIIDNKIQLPCEIGAPIYIVEKCGYQCGIFDENYYRCIENLNNGKRKKSIAIGRKHKSNIKYSTLPCTIIYKRPFKIEYLFKFGKTVFIHLEDAINELKKQCAEYTINYTEQKEIERE